MTDPNQRIDAQRHVPSAGFSLVELMVALALFALMAAGMASMTIQSRKMSEAIIFEDQVNRSVSNFLEEIRGIGHGRVWNVTQTPSIGFDLTLPDISGSGASKTVNVPIAILDDNERLSNWTDVDIEATTKDGNSATVTVGLRIELNNHQNFASENTAGVEVIMHYRWQLPWESSNNYRFDQAIAYIADETP